MRLTSLPKELAGLSTLSIRNESHWSYPVSFTTMWSSVVFATCVHPRSYAEEETEPLPRLDPSNRVSGACTLSCSVPNRSDVTILTWRNVPPQGLPYRYFYRFGLSPKGSLTSYPPITNSRILLSLDTPVLVPLTGAGDREASN